MILGLSVATFVMMWPALYNGQPFFFPDTADYVNAADAGVHKVTGMTSHWTQPEQSTLTTSAENHGTRVVPGKSVRAGRSIYYGTLLYLGDRAGGFWLSVGVQSLLLVLALMLVLRNLKLTAWPCLGVLVLVVALLTPAALFASFLMPDIFAGIAILACSMLISTGAPRRRRDDISWFVLLTLSLIMHTSHVMVAMLILAVSLLAYLTNYAKVSMHGLLLVGGALALAYVAGAGFNYAVTRFMGESPIMPPFITARTIEDGPGYQFLLDTCPENGFVVCGFLNRLPMSTDEFLWSHDPAHGVFGSTDDLTRRRLSHEQWPFVLAVVRHAPLAQSWASIHNALRQIFLVSVPEFQYSDEEKRDLTRETPEIYKNAMRRTAAYRGTMPIGWLSFLSFSSMVVGIAYIAWALWSADGMSSNDGGVVYRLAALVIIGVIGNAIVCATISGPHDRYQARVIWLLPMIATTLHFARHERWWRVTFSRLSRAIISN